jgi:hypothetical protein
MSLGIGIIASQRNKFLLDQYAGAAAAYSLRKLRSGYTGNAIRVRRSSDNTEEDIGFTSAGNLDESALTTFVGANNGFVVTWYDQSGNAVDFTNATANSQPTILQSGAVNKTNNKSSINGFDIGKNLISSLTLGSGISLFSVTSSLSNSGVFLSEPPNNDYLLISQVSSSGTSQNVGTPTYYKNSNQLSLTTRTSTYNQFYLTGQVLLSITSLNFSGWSSFELERSGSITFDGWGIMQELIFYSNSPSRTGVESNINQYYSIY